MAGIQLTSDISSALSTTFDALLSRQFNRTAVTASLLKAVPETTGKQVAWDVLMNGASASCYAEGADVGNGEYNVDKPVPATLAFGLYRSAFWVSSHSLEVAAGSLGNAVALQNLFGERMFDSVTALSALINSEIISGTGTTSGNPGIFGLLGSTALSATGIYANIDRSTYPLWAGNVLANGGTPRALTVDLMDLLEQNIYVASNVRPNCIVTTPGVVRKFKGLFTPYQRFNAAGPNPRFDASTTEIFYQGIPVIRDKDMTTGTMAFLNTDQVSLRFPAAFGSADPDNSMAASMVSSNGQDADVISLPFSVEALAKTGDSMKIMVRTALQLKVARPSSCGYISDISEV